MDSSVEVKILIVDDMPANLITLEAVLDPLHYDIIRAHSGFEALAILKSTDISLVILDVQMPELDGFETAKRIKAEMPDKNIPIIFMTAIYTEDPYIHKGYEVGGVDYFGKPFDPEVLKAKVRLHAEMFRKTKLLEQLDKKLKEADRRQKLLLDSVLDIVCVTSPDGTVVYLNGAFEAQTGYKMEDWIGKSIFSLVRSEDLKEAMACIRKTVNEQKSCVIDTAILEGLGRHIPVKIYTRAFVSEDEVKGAICVARRVTEKRAVGRPRKDDVPQNVMPKKQIAK